MSGNYNEHAAVWEWAGQDRSAEISFWLTLAGKYGIRALSAMCATGHVADALATAGLAVTAIDITQEMIRHGRQNYGGNANLTFIEGDICTLDLQGKAYDFAFIGTTDLHHLHSEEARHQALSSLANHTRSGGGLGLELWYPSTDSWDSPWREFQPLVPPAAGEPKVWKRGKTVYDVEKLLVTISQEVFVESNGLTKQFPHSFTLQLFSREDLFDMLSRAGYRVTTEYGSYELELWTPQSDKWLVEAVNQGNPKEQSKQC